MRHLALPFIVCLVAAYLTASCGKGKGEAAPVPNKDGQPATVVLATATAGELEETVEVTGSLLPWREATVSIEADGRIAALSADIGSAVAAGSVIARVAPEEYHLKVRQAEAELKAAKADLARITNLVEKSMATQQQADETARRVEVARVALDTAKKKLADTELRTPFDGTIAKRLVNEGEYVRTGTALFQIVQTNPLKFVAGVPERYATGVKSGTRVTVTAATGETSTGIIRRVGPVVDQQSRAFTIEAEVPNRDRTIKAGTFATARIALPGKRSVVMVPETALVSFAGTDKVFVLVGDHIEERIVTVAGRTGTTIALEKGLAAGDRVVTSAAETLYHGMKAVPREE